MSKFLYIPSAFESAGRFLTAHRYYPKIVLELLENLHHQEKDIDIAVLANAFSEKKDLEEFYKILNPLGYDIISDSGGLQVINTGANITPELKKQIYKLQSEYSTLAMSFDEIPLQVLNRTGGGGFGLTVQYVDSWFKIKAKESGKNLAEQIRFFQKNKTNAKVMFIMQGKTFAEIREWAWFQYQEIKDIPGHEDFIGGLALGSTGKLGARNLTDFILRYQQELEFLPDSWKMFLHVLGAGSLSRIIAYLLINDEYFLKGTLLSSDSTTQTRAKIFGSFNFYVDKKLKLEALPQLGMKYNAVTKEHLTKIYEYAKPVMEKYAKEYNIEGNIDTFDNFREHYSQYNDNHFYKRDQFRTQEKLSKKELEKLSEEELEKYEQIDKLETYNYTKRNHISGFLWTMCMLSSFIKHLQVVKTLSNKHRAGDTTAKKKLKKSIGSKLFNSYFKLLDIKDHKDYMKGYEDEIIVGHPYKMEFSKEDLEQADKDGVLKKGQKFYILDEYNGKILGRELKASSPNYDQRPVTEFRGQFLNKLQGVTIPTIRVSEEETANNLLDEW